MCCTKREEARKILLAMLDELDQADRDMQKILQLGTEAYINKLQEKVNIDFLNLGQCTLIADEWLKEKKKEL